MRKFLSVLGGLFLALLLGMGGMIGYGVMDVSKLNAQSKTYVEANLPGFFAHATADQLVSFMAPADRAKVKADELVSYYAFVNEKLGDFKSCDSVEGGAFEMVNPNGKTVTAQYLVHCYFDKASIKANVTLRKTGDSWSLVGVHFNTDTLAPARDGGKSI